MSYAEVRFVVKHTFIELLVHDEADSPKLRRNKSDPVLSCSSLEASGMEFSHEYFDAPTPTTCASVNGDGDDSSLQINGLPNLLETTCQAATRYCEVATIWPTTCGAPVLLSTYPTKLTADTMWHSWGITEDPQNHSSGSQVGDALDTAMTTLMVRNIPSDLSQTALVQQLIDIGFSGLFDFVYMPVNFRESGNFGYAFVNFADHAVAMQLMAHFLVLDDCEKWNMSWSTCQGLSANIERYRNSPLMHESVPKECKPAVYNRNGYQVPFPKPTKTISRPRIHWGSKDAQNTESQIQQPPARNRVDSSIGHGCDIGAVHEFRPNRSSQRRRRAN